MLHKLTSYVKNTVLLTSSIFLMYTSTVITDGKDKILKDSETVNNQQYDLEAGLNTIDNFVSGEYKAGTTIAGKEVELHEATVGKYNIQKLAGGQEIEPFLAVFDRTRDNYRGFADIDGFRVYMDLDKYPTSVKTPDIMNEIYDMKANQENQRKISEGVLTVINGDNVEKLENLVKDTVEAIKNR